MPLALSLAFILVALILAVIELSKAKLNSPLAWAILSLAISLVINTVR